MALYLRKYVGEYRVKADYDLDTNDFPRLENGSIDPSFDDLYIDCKNDIRIRHGVGNVLSCYIPSKQRGMNILRQIYIDNVSDKLPKDLTYLENLCEELVKKNILVSAEVLDGEVYFEFKATMIGYIAELVGVKTTGKTIQPFSLKNLPKTAYKIPEEDMEIYKKAIENFPSKTVEINGKPRTMPDGLLIKAVNKKFDKIILQSKPNGFDLDKDKRIKGLNGKEYIHSLGMWEQYCEFLKTFV